MLNKCIHLFKVCKAGASLNYNAERCVVAANLISKRYAGHSEWANRLKDKESGRKKKESKLERYRVQIKACIISTKNPNPATNRKLQSIVNNARSDCVSISTIDKWIKGISAGIDAKNTFRLYYLSPTGVAGLVEVGGTNTNTCHCAVAPVMKKYGFKLVVHPYNLYSTTGVIISRPSEGDEHSFDRAMENAIVANCEEVNQIDDNCYEFYCTEEQIDVCSKNLADQGYVVEGTTVRVNFAEYIHIADEAILQKLDEIRSKLEQVMGFMEINYNVE